MFMVVYCQHSWEGYNSDYVGKLLLFIQIVAVATINFSLAQVWLLAFIRWQLLLFLSGMCSNSASAAVSRGSKS